MSAARLGQNLRIHLNPWNDIGSFEWSTAPTEILNPPTFGSIPLYYLKCVPAKRKLTRRGVDARHAGATSEAGGYS